MRAVGSLAVFLEHVSKAILKTVADNYDGEQLPLFDQADASGSAAQLGWVCQELVVRTGTRNSEQERESVLGDRNGKVGHVQIEAKLNTSLDTILLYQAALKRDLYRAITALRAGQGISATEARLGIMDELIPAKA
jgi:hypothetical protein